MKLRHSITAFMIFGMIIVTGFFGTISSVEGAIITLPGYDAELFTTVTSGGDLRNGLVQIDEAPDGTLFVGQDFYDAHSQIYKITPDRSWTLFGSPAVLDPDAVTVNSAGTIFTGGDGYIYELTPSGSSSLLTGREFYPAGPHHLEVSPSDQLYAMGDHSSIPSIYEVSSTGTVSLFGMGESITFDETGNIYILRYEEILVQYTNGTGGTLLTGVLGAELEYHPSGFFLTVGDGNVYLTPLDGSGQLILASGFKFPFDVTVAASGDIYVTDHFDVYRIYKMAANEPPVADSGEDQIVNEGDRVELDGSVSSDPDGTIEFYEWDFDFSDGLWWDTGGSPDATEPMTSHIYGDDGEFVVTLRVTDNENTTDIDTINVTVLNVNPKVSIESVSMDVEIGLRVAGRTFNDVGMTLSENKKIVGYVSIERMPGSPDDQMAWIPITMNLTRMYYANVFYNPEDPPNIGGNPVWIYIRFPNGSIQKIHHTFNVQQSKKRDNDHWNHVAPWEVDINSNLTGWEFKVEYKVTDPGSDDEIMTFSYGSQIVVKVRANNPPGLDPYPSPEINPVDFFDFTELVYEGPGQLTLNVKDDDNIRLSTSGSSTEIELN